VIAHSFKEAIIEMMSEIAKEIPDSHKQTPLQVVVQFIITAIAEYQMI